MSGNSIISKGKFMKGNVSVYQATDIVQFI